MSKAEAKGQIREDSIFGVFLIQNGYLHLTFQYIAGIQEFI